MPIYYAEWKCDICGDRDYPLFAILRNGKIVCESCANKNPDQVFKWIEIRSSWEEPEEEPEA